MRRVTFGQFLQRATIFEYTPVSVDPGLRRGVWISWLITGIYWVIYRFLPDGSFIEEVPFFHWTRHWLADTWYFVADYRQLFLISCTFIFSLTLILLALTRGFHLAEIRLQIMLFFPIVFVAINLPFIVALLLPVLVNLFLWLCVSALVLLGGVIIIGTVLRMFFR